MTAYTCPLAGLLLLGGRVADRVGRRRAFLTGLAGFALASALAGAAPYLGALVAGRALQGAFAALLTPTALSLVAVTFTEGRERAKAFGVYGAVASSGAAVGLLLGGVLTEYAGWRSCLFVNVVVALAAGIAGRAVLPRDSGHPSARVDAASGLLVTAGLAGLVLGCARAAGHGWASVAVLAPVLAGALLLAAFLVRQRRLAAPLLPLGLLADRSRAGAYLAVAVSVVGSFGMFLMLTYHFQVVLGWSPVQAGLAFLPLSAAVSLSAYGLGSRLLPVLAPRWLVAPGLLTAAAGLALLATLEPTSGYLTRDAARRGARRSGDGAGVHAGDQRRHARRRTAPGRRGCGHRDHRDADGWRARDGRAQQHRGGRHVRLRGAATARRTTRWCTGSRWPRPRLPCSWA